MVPAQPATSSMARWGPRISARVPRASLDAGSAVTSTAIMSMETRPTMGQRFPAMYTCAGPSFCLEERWPRHPILVACSQNRDAAVARRFPGGAVANRVALLHVAHLQHGAFKCCNGFHRVLLSRRRVAAIERNAGAAEVVGEVTAQKNSRGICEACRALPEAFCEEWRSALPAPH